MKETLYQIYESLIELESSNMLVEDDIKRLEDEFNQISQEGEVQALEVIDTKPSSYEDMVLLRIFAKSLNKDLLLEKEFVYYRNKIISWAIAAAITLVGFIPVCLFFVSGSIFAKIAFMFAGITFNSLVNIKNFKNYFQAKKEYKVSHDNIVKTSSNNEAYKYLIDLKNKVKDLEEKKKNNKGKLEKLKKEFIKLFESLMEEKYKELGIDEQIKIEWASLLTGSTNTVKLELKAPTEVIEKETSKKGK